MTRIIALGASAGGVESLREVVGGLPSDFPAPVLVVLHVPAYEPSSLPDILSRAGPLPACHPKDGDRIRAGRIYVGPPDHHLLVQRANDASLRGDAHDTGVAVELVAPRRRRGAHRRAGVNRGANGQPLIASRRRREWQ